MTERRGPRVLHVVGGLQLGGGEKLTALVAGGLHRSGWQVSVLNLGSPGEYGASLRAQGIEVIDLSIPQRPRPSDAGRVLRGLLAMGRVLFRRPRWDVVHTHMFRTSLLVAIPARLAGSRLFGTVHRVYYRWQPPVERVLSPLHEAIVVDSSAVGRILQARTRIREDRYAVIHNGIDRAELDMAPDRQAARAALGIQVDVTLVTEIAHLEPHKGQAYLLAAFARVGGARDRLLLVGSGAELGTLRALARELRIEDRVTFLGARPDLAVILAASDIVALPSTYEGFGIVQAEAMYLERPVIGTSYGGATEVVVDGATGFLVPYGDVDALAERLGRLLASPALRAAFGTAGRERVLAQFTAERMTERYAALYARTLRRGLGEAAADRSPDAPTT